MTRHGSEQADKAKQEVQSGRPAATPKSTTMPRPLPKIGKSNIYGNTISNRVIISNNELSPRRERMDEKRSLELGIIAQIDSAKKLVCEFIKNVSPEALAYLEQHIRDAFARASEQLTDNVTAEERICHFAGRKKWVTAKKETPSLTPLQHIENVYSDRREFGLRRCDLADQRIDPKLYQALAAWLRPKKNGKKNVLPKDFGLPKKSEITDRILNDIRATRRTSVISLFSEKDASLIRAVRAQTARSGRRKRRLSGTVNPNHPKI